MEKTKATWNDPMLSVENAKHYLEGRLLRTRYLLNTTEFGHFYIMSDYQKNRILAPLERLLQMQNVKLSKIPIDPNYSHYFDFYYGQFNGNGKRHGLGAYGWCPEKDDEDDYNVEIFVGQFNDGEITDDGVYYTWSSEDAKNRFTVQGEFAVTALVDPYPIDENGKKKPSKTHKSILTELSVLLFIVFSVALGIYTKWWIGIIVFFVGLEVVFPLLGVIKDSIKSDK